MSSADNAESFLSGPAPIHDDNVIRNIQKQHPSVFLVCQKSKNKNIAVYEALHRNGKLCDPPITGYCLVLDPGSDYQPKRRAQGIPHDRSPFNVMDLTYAWGYESKRVSDTEAQFWFTQKPTQKFKVVLGPNLQAKMMAEQNGRSYMLRSMHVTTNDVFHLFDPARNIKELYFEGLDMTAKPPKASRIHWNG